MCSPRFDVLALRSPTLSVGPYVYIYIYRERERERNTYIYIYI